MNQGTSRPVVSATALCLVAGVCTFAAWFFIPDERELVNRLDKDGHVDRLKALAEEALKEETTLRTPPTDAGRMKSWLDSTDPDVRYNPAVIAEKKIMCAITEMPSAVGAEVVVGVGKLEPELFAEFMDALSRRALGLQRQAEAGRLLSQWNQRQPSWELTLRAVQAWRWAVKSAEALKTLDGALAGGLDPQECPENITGPRLKLALESNQPNLAFDIVNERYAKAAENERPALLRRLLELANAGDRTPQAGKLIAAHLETLPFHTLPLEKAIQTVAGGRPFASAEQEADYREYATALARWGEWAGHGAEAIDLWFRLSLLGSEEAWARALDLYEEVLRTEDFIKVLAFRISKGISLDKRLLLAGLLVDQGRVDEAIRHYEAALTQLADPALANRALARIYQQQGDWEKSLAAFSRVLTAWPGDVEAAKGRAFALVRLGKFEEAANAYVLLAKAQPNDAEVQEICAGLCDSLGRSTEARETTQRLLECEGRESTPEEHMELANDFRMIGDLPATVSALRSGFQRHSQSLRLRLTLAEALSQGGDHDEAVRLLAFDALRENPAALDLLVSEAVEASNGSVAVNFISNDPPECLNDLPLSRLRLAFLLDRLGRKLEADRLMAELLRDPRHRQSETCLEMGRLCLSVGDSLHAETFVELYLTATVGSNPKAWELLGDIFQSLDRNEDALTAYRKAVEIIGTPQPATARPETPGVKVSQNGADVP